MTCNMSSPNPEKERERSPWQKMVPDASTTGSLSTLESKTARRSQFVVTSEATGVIVEKPCARDPRSPVPLTLAVQKSLTL